MKRNNHNTKNAWKLPCVFCCPSIFNYYIAWWIRLKDRNNGVAVGLFDKLSDLIGLQCFDQCLNVLAVLVAFAHCHDVGVLLCSFGGLFLADQHLIGDACCDGIVAVDDCKVNIRKGARQLGSLHLHDLYVVRIGGDVLLGRFQTGVRVDFDDALCLQQLQGSCLVGSVVWNGNLCTVLPP